MHEQGEYRQPLLLELPERFDLVCLGSSLFGYYAITLDAVRHLQAARCVFLYALNEDHFAFLRQFNPTAIDLNRTLYIDGAARADAYRNIINFVLAEARRGGVAYVSQGSSVFQTYTALELVRRARAEGLVASLLPGVSSLECLLTSIGLTEAIDELQIHTCEAVASCDARLDPRTPCFLFNVSAYAAAVVNMRGSLKRNEHPGALAALAKALMAIYPSDHPVLLMHLGPAGNTSVVASTIARLARDLAGAQPGITLYLRALRPEMRTA